MARDMMSNFEIPIEVRQLAVKSVDEAKRAFDSLVVAAQKVTTSLAGQAAAALSGSKEVHSKVRTFAERNVATCFEFAQKFVHAKNVQGVMQLQAELVKTQLQAVLEQTTELADAAIKTVVGVIQARELTCRQAAGRHSTSISQPRVRVGLYSVHRTFRHARERGSCLDRAQEGLSASLPPRACPARRRGAAQTFSSKMVIRRPLQVQSIPGQPRRW